MTESILPPATIGIIGGGQLGMMIVREAQRMGYRTVVWDPDSSCPASRLADRTITASFTDHAAAGQLSTLADVVTYEFENVDAGMVRWLEERNVVHPGSRILEISQYRRTEKDELRRRGFPTVEYRLASTPEELSRAVGELGYPVVAKTVSAGYDGKGQYVWRTKAEFTQVRASDLAGEYIIEAFLPLACELSVIGVRGYDGNVVTFPVAENTHRDNILYTTVVPPHVSVEMQRRAEKLCQEVIESFDIIGELCVEMFVTEAGQLLINELAPRPHNSGHYTLDACDMSQFEALIRAICGLPLPAPRLLTPCAMLNLLGRDIRHLGLPSIFREEGVKFHLYGKKEVRARRKMGHITILGLTQDEVTRRLRNIAQMMEHGRTAQPDLKA